MVTVSGIDLDFDIQEELQPFLSEFGSHRVRGNKFQACSPFRTESHPSFAVNLDTGVWVDSGANTEEHRKGHLVALLSYLRGETWEDTVKYLLYKYSPSLVDTDGLKLEFELNRPEEYKIFKKEDLRKYLYRSSYLAGRGITEEIQRMFGVGYDTENKSVMLPWFDIEGYIINAKFRSTKSKYFYYFPDGQRIKQHLYGLYQVLQSGVPEVLFITESEIDTLYLWSMGIKSVALGGASISDKQVKLLHRLGASIVIATDNDGAGFRCAHSIRDNLAKHLKVSRLRLPESCKDVNDLYKLGEARAMKILTTRIEDFSLSPYLNTKSI